MKEYLKKIVELRTSIGSSPPGYNYVCMEDYVLDRGKQYEERPLTENEQKIVRRAQKDKFFPIGHCFFNAQQLVMADRSKKLIYVEGFASVLFPVLHAWAVINGAVVDVTWESIDDKRPRIYYGVEFNRDAIKKKRREKYELSIIDDWRGKYPLLKEARKGAP